MVFVSDIAIFVLKRDVKLQPTIQNGLVFLIPTKPGCPGKEAVKRVSVVSEV